jgi:hypothetical protein
VTITGLVKRRRTVLGVDIAAFDGEEPRPIEVGIRCCPTFLGSAAQ